MTTPQPMPHLGVLGHVEPAWKGDCLTGIQHSHALGFTGQDVNVHVTKDGHVVGAHNATISGYHDPTGKISDNARIANLTLAQIQTLVPKAGGPQRMDAVTNWFGWCAQNGFSLLLEWKPDTHTADTTSRLAWRRVAAEAKATGAVVVAATIQCWASSKLKGAAKAAQLDKWEKAAKLRMRTAANSGVPTVLLYRRAVSKDWLPLLSGVKGGPARKNVAHLGNGPGAVTAFGGSVAASKIAAAKARIRKLGGTFPPKVTGGQPVPTPTPTPTPDPTPAPAPPAAGHAKVASIARKYIGVHEGRSGGHWNNDNPFAKKMGFANGQAWCATFVCAVFKEAGLLNLITTPSPGVDQLAVGFKRAKRWSEYPALGAVVFYGKPSDLNHTGIVVAYDADTVTTVEGNTNDNGSREGDGVYLKKRLRRSTNLIGYGYPRYAEPITSADPKWARTAPTTATKAVGGAPDPTPPATHPPAGWKPRIDGVDLSHWQSGAIDFAKAKRAGVQFVSHKATEHTTYKDPKYGARRKQAAAAGIPFGGYHFAKPRVSGGASQARWFLKVASPKAGDLRPMLDLEDAGGLSMPALTRWVEDFAAVVRAQTGKPPLLYTNFNLTRDPGCYLWRARYNNDNRQPDALDAWVRWTIWQFSNGVLGRPNHVPGIGNCDINVLFPGFEINKLTL